MFFKKFSLAKIVFYPIKKIYPLLLPSHNCIIIFIQCSVFKVHLWIPSKKFNEASCFQATSVNLLKEVVGQNGLEPSTSRLSVVCSSQLSYWPIRLLFWWRLAGSNRWPPACKAGALPAELNPQIFLHHLKLHFSMYPLNWITHRVSNTSCTDLRTLQQKSSLLLKSP